MASGRGNGPIPNDHQKPFDGRYILGDQIGRGGAATVFRAVDRETGATVAIKVLRRDLADTVTAERFLRETRLAQQLRHPSIVPVLDAGAADGVPYYVMPVFPDGTLAQRLQSQGALPFDVVLRVVSEIATALDFAHGYEILHRDVKPQNVLFDGSHALLADFGIALALDPVDTHRLTDSGVVLGTPLYMSPEQACADVVDGRSDVYSLGCIAYEMITGEPPFSAPTVKAVIAKHCAEPVPSIAVVRPTVPSGLQATLETALAKVPADRYATAGDFARALSNVLPPAPFTPSSYRSLSPSRSGAAVALPVATTKPRHFWPWAAGLVAAIVLAGALHLRGSGGRAEPASVLDPRRIAVLYFDDLSPGASQGFLADGLTETLIDQLTTVPSLTVISPAGVRPFRGKSIRLDSLARVLGVGTIVGGSVQRSGDSVRVAVRLIDAASGQQLYSESLRQPSAKILQIQDSLTAQLAFALRQRLGDVIAVRATRASTASPAAWEEAQLASQVFQAALDSHRTRNDIRGSHELFLRADGRYARAESLDGHWPLPTFKRAVLARVVAQYDDGLAPPDEGRTPPRSGRDSSYRSQWLARALRLGAEALKKGTDSANVFDLRGGVYYQLALMSGPADDSLFNAAESAFQSAVNLKPNLAGAWSGLADVYLRDGRFADAASAAREAYRADAFFEVRSTISNGFLAALYSQRFDEAKVWCDAGLTRYPGDPQFAECRLRVLGWTTGQKPGDVTRAWTELADIERRDSTGQLGASWGSRRFMVAATVARAGMKDSALKIVDRIHAHQQAEGGPAPGRLEEAYVQLLLGNRNQALSLLERHVAAAPVARPLIARHPWFVPLHGDPRFDALTRQTR